MKMVELIGAKGLAVWVNAGQVSYFHRTETVGEGSMYGSNNTKSGARIWFSSGGHLDVRETAEEIAAQMAA